MFEPIEVHGKALGVRIIRARIRNSYARVKDGNIVISVPERFSDRKINEVASSLYTRLAKALQRKPGRYMGMSKLRFYDGQKVPVLGNEFEISIRSAPISRPRSRHRGSTISIVLPEAMDRAEKDDYAAKIIRKKITKAIHPQLVSIVNGINSRHFNSEIEGIRIRDNATLWGSCSRNNDITLNFRLLYAPQRILEYVIVHELAHTKVKRHSQRFWDLVGSIIPDHKERRRWLKNNAYEIKPAGLPAETIPLPS